MAFCHFGHCFNIKRQQNNAVNKSLASVINNWNDFSKYFYELVKSYAQCCVQYDLLTLKLLATVLILFGGGSLSSIFFSCFWILFHDSTALTVIEYFPYLFVL